MPISFLIGYTVNYKRKYSFWLRCEKPF